MVVVFMLGVRLSIVWSEDGLDGGELMFQGKSKARGQELQKSALRVSTKFAYAWLWSDVICQPMILHLSVPLCGCPTFERQRA